LKTSTAPILFQHSGTRAAAAAGQSHATVTMLMRFSHTVVLEGQLICQVAECQLAGQVASGQAIPQSLVRVPHTIRKPLCTSSTKQLDVTTDGNRHKNNPFPAADPMQSSLQRETWAP